MARDAFVELRTYLRVLRRRWPFVVVPTLVVLLIAALTFRVPQPTYEATVRYIVSQEPTASANVDEEARQFTWIVSQYVVNAVTDWVNGTDFATRVAEQVALEPLQVDAAIEADTFRSILEVVISHPEEQTVQALAEATTAVLVADVAQAIPQLGTSPAQIDPIDQVYVVPVSAGYSAYMDVPLRVVVALATGIGIALLFEYIDPKIYRREQVDQIGLPLVAEIPAE